ncbi:uncharacterized protein G6M90_00g089860 [Metarhizium brunneum]|uniref:Uncharacterized protein n=1 Tax=Metarhizium brunneum TaxID=500148 RepID=A0A7D5V1Q0_9HYPO|nr:hypothetical protein G6M90_00g089860 [Metarhizium brunneum]
MVDEEEEVEPECAKDELELGLLAVQEVDVILFRLIAEVSGVSELESLLVLNSLESKVQDSCVDVWSLVDIVQRPISSEQSVVGVFGLSDGK